MWRLNRDTKAAGVNFVGKVCGAAEPHPGPSVTSRCCCLKFDCWILDLDLTPPTHRDFPCSTREQGKHSQGAGFQQPRPGGRIVRRIWFSSSILPWAAKGGPAPTAVRAATGSFMPLKYYPGEILEAWDQASKQRGPVPPHSPLPPYELPSTQHLPWNAKPPLQIEENQNEAFVGIVVFLKGRYPEGCITEGPVRGSLGMD